MSDDDYPKAHCFLAFPYSEEFAGVRAAVRKGVMEAGYKVMSSEKRTQVADITLRDAIIGKLAGSDCVIADITDRNPNVFFELGLAQAMGKGLLTISNKKVSNNVPFDARQFPTLTYDESPRSLAVLSKNVSATLQEYRKFPQRSQALRGLASSPSPFFVDWDRLEESEFENLCRELLTLMGFRRLEWGKVTPEIDLVAEFPRKDPDGFEYRELWMISMGLHAPVEMFLEMMAMGDSDIIFHRILKYSEGFERSLSKGSETPITFLVILPRASHDTGELDRLTERMDRRRMKRGSLGFSPRFRFWDQAYLTSLVHQFPQIGYKYFSDESRIRSKTRKSYEDLYGENSEMLRRLSKLVEELGEEKNKRVRAERDAIWKEISFSAAHKIGNPVFAIETDLEPLVKRIREQRTPEAIEVVDNMRSSVDKAKAFVEQFKSLARSQEIKQTAITLRPLLADAAKALGNSGCDFSIECPPGLAIWADSDRISECLDELVANAKHWFDKQEKRMEFKVVFPVPEPLPSFLDTDAQYVLIHVKDNGCGIEVANKQKIFNAFFTTYDHGTGLGLALVRRIIDGHGGGILESGVFGQGADFEIYLPIPPAEKPSKKPVAKERKNSKRK
jgi:signal transduction histidine kinase